MPQKLIYTSAPRLLQAGRSGFGTVAMSREIPTEVVKAAENFSQFSRQPGMESVRVVYSYRVVRCGDGVRHVLSCIRDAGADYSGRTNHLAQHLIFDDREAATCASSGFTPAGVLLGTEWPNHDGYCGWIESAPQWASSDPEPTWQWWTHYSSSPECRFNLCTQTALRGSVFVYGKGLEKQTENEAKSVLCLFAEAQLECPNRGWGVTFSTSYEPNDELSDFKWIGVPENSPLLAKLETSAGREWVTLDSPPAARPAPTPIAKPSHRQAGQDSRRAGSGDAGVYSGGPALAGATRTASPPPILAPDKESHARAKNSLFSARNIAIVALSVVALLSVVFLLRSIFAPVEVQLVPATLKTTYNGGSHAVQLLKGPQGAKMLYAKIGAENWSTDGPVNGGTYRLKLEVPGLFRTRLVPLGENLVIERQKPEIRFPDNLEFEHDGHEPKIEPSITPAEAAAGHQIVYKARGTSEWTNSPPRSAGEHLVRASTAETVNYYAVTNETKFTINKTPSSAPSGLSAQQQAGATIAATTSLNANSKFTNARTVLLPERKSAQWLSQIERLPVGKPSELQFRGFPTQGSETPTEYQPTTFSWKLGTNGLPSGKPADFTSAPLNYRLAYSGGMTIQILELVNGAGAAIQKLFKTGPFYLERTGAEAGNVRLAPPEFFSGSLELLPKGAFFEVSFETREFSVPSLKFQRGPTGWQSKVPLGEIDKLVAEAQKEVESL
jgi:hypothetical protein